MEDLTAKALAVLAQANNVILGKEQQVSEVFLTLLAGGHVLLEDVPGVGKTTLAKTFSKAMALDCRRVQFTPDLMPSDLTGFSVYRREEEKFVYQPGSVFCNLLLADELNRTSPKTQSALLEVMEEGQVSAEGVTRAVPKPFLVIAAQNPSGSVGTGPLPEAQVDRFMTSVTLGYPDLEHELQMAMQTGGEPLLEQVTPIIGPEELMMMQEQVSKVYLRDNVCRYIVELIRATRSSPDLQQGASPRATSALVQLSRAAAWMRGSSYVTPEDAAGQFPYVVRHRITLSAAARMEGIGKEEVISGILKGVKKPPLGERRR